MFETKSSSHSPPISATAVFLVDFPNAFADVKAHKSQDSRLNPIIQRLLSDEKVGTYLLKQGLLY